MVGLCHEMQVKQLKIWLHSLGCRTNQSEMESIASGLVERGFILSDTPGGCFAAVINSCSVTATADKKSRQCVRMARREMPNGLIIACGCWAQKLSKDEARDIGIDYVVPNRRKGGVIGLISGQPKGNLPAGNWDDLPLLCPTLRSRAFIKIQEGCDHFCSYCIVPFLRGRATSRPFDDVMREITSVAESGCEEIILTGTNLGGYPRLAELAREISDIPVRLQFGSIEPFSIDEKLLRALAGMKQKFVPPLHIPLQSGDDEILKMMRRGYTASEYLAKIEQVRKFLGNIALNTDLLVGFPSESEEAFQRSLALIREVGFAHVHIFPFSPREGTDAAKFQNQIPKNIISERAQIAKDVNRH